ncbi:hypothetical protein BDV25DRAFT_43063 [Aspergillus avenaceus]|uniref:Zn(2)-C6 fungal-type domain-containing protein n=1 Tax=Aspergillus avenaceus TaxID=36643 RepID=A0A5N6TLL9_ASPAV|nr:hypothetical protein BDV25DRAFT_43063 [Aspergillus avenaceus]
MPNLSVRVRRVKCDEAPGECINCRSTGRICDGYDTHRLRKRGSILRLPDLATGRWFRSMTSDERRMFSYFQHHSIAHLIAMSGSDLWQTLVLQMAHADPAVFHAVNMFAAIHEDSEVNKMRLSHESLHRPRHRIALEQSTRALARLNQRRASQDPQLRQVVLLCCLLFTTCEFLLGQYDRALSHLDNGVQMVKEAWANGPLDSKVDRCLVLSFCLMDLAATQYRGGAPMFTEHELESWEISKDPSSIVHTLHDAQRVLNSIMCRVIPFVAHCWALSPAEFTADWVPLSMEQQQLLALAHLGWQTFHAFCERSYIHLNPREKGTADLIRLQYESHTAMLELLFYDESLPESRTPDFAALLASHEAFVNRFPEFPTIFLDYGIIPGFFVVATFCPDYALRRRAINFLLACPHFQLMMNSNIAGAVALVALESEQQVQSGQNIPSTAPQNQEMTRFLSETMSVTRRARNWSFFRVNRVTEPPAIKAREYHSFLVDSH